ncbi:zinc ribbon domain-containing protein [Streptomyces sp. NPDC048350]|uniref:zinc ribbon domain-containing protein n=1 Tax=Streptomyces sp. NPDC048350 TaxID=3365538 RepID=UPI00370F8DF3
MARLFCRFPARGTCSLSIEMLDDFSGGRGRHVRFEQGIWASCSWCRGLACTCMARSVNDAGWSQFVTMLEYKAAQYGRTLIRIGRFEPTSQVCSQCGVKGSPKAPAQPCVGMRGAWCRPRPGHQRVVATAAGLAVPVSRARVGPGAVPAQREETGTHPKPRQTTARHGRRESPSFRTEAVSGRGFASRTLPGPF